MICPNCGKENGETNFCEFCGAKMTGIKNIKMPNIDLSKMTDAVSNVTNAVKNAAENVKNTTHISSKSNATKGIDNLKEKLVGLKDLFDTGLITEEEYNQKRTELVKSSQI